MSLTAVLGAFWGDEGKGKVAAALSVGASICARFQGGPNAAHTVHVDGRKLVFRMVPAGIVAAEYGVIGNGAVLDPELLVNEVDALGELVPGVRDRLRISTAAHVILPEHRERDRGALSQSIGTTKMGVGPAYADKIARHGVRVADLVDPRFEPPDERSAHAAERFRALLGPCCVDTGELLREALDDGAEVVAEGAQGALLDIDHGDYPFVTSSNTTVGAVLSGLGVGVRDVGRVVVVASAYMTKVGGGAFPTRIDGVEAEFLRSRGEEVDGATGLLRDCGWLDLARLRWAAAVNRADGIVLTKLDVVGGLPEIALVDSSLPPEEREIRLSGWDDELSGTQSLEDLPSGARAYVETVEACVGVPVVGLSVGQELDEYFAVGSAALR
jgi:adenylosuccinate synthase